METEVTPPPDTELNLLMDWSDPVGRVRAGRSAVLSLIVHGAAILFLIAVPETLMQPPLRERVEPLVTPLITPPLTLTQHAPNPTKAVREMRSADLTPRMQLPKAKSADPQMPAPRKEVATPAPPPPPKSAPQTPLPEPPKTDIASAEPPKLLIPVQPPQPKTPAFEDVRPATPIVPKHSPTEIGDGSVESAIKGNLHGPGLNTTGTAQVPSSGAELPQLLSDAKGVDFTPYLAHVLASVKSYWNTIRPKNGKRGDVSVQFAIERDGTVPKIVFVTQTGDRTLDQAAIEAISGGAPFGPLPAKYTGSEIHVQMNFLYNTVSR